MIHDWSSLESECALVKELRTELDKNGISYGVIYSFLIQITPEHLASEETAYARTPVVK